MKVKALIRTLFLCAPLSLFAPPAAASGPEQFRAFITGTHSARASFSQTVTASSGSLVPLRKERFATWLPNGSCCQRTDASAGSWSA